PPVGGEPVRGNNAPPHDPAAAGRPLRAVLARRRYRASTIGLPRDDTGRRIILAPTRQRERSARAPNPFGRVAHERSRDGRGQWPDRAIAARLVRTHRRRRRGPLSVLSIGRAGREPAPDPVSVPGGRQPVARLPRHRARRQGTRTLHLRYSGSWADSTPPTALIGA